MKSDVQASFPRGGHSMQVSRTDTQWSLVVEESDNQLGLINTIRFLDKISDEIAKAAIPNLILELDLAKLANANSELIAKFVELQTHLVRHDGRLAIINANPELKSAFDVVMLDKIIGIQYIGQDENSESSYDEEDDYDYDEE